MALVQNNYRDLFTGARWFGATLSNGSSPYGATPATANPGAARNIFLSEAGISKLSSKPAGARNPLAWQMPQRGGGLASHNATAVSLSQTGAAVLGLPGSGSATITFTETATGGLIVSGSGSATITFTSSSTLISVASGSGSSTITVSTSGLIGALAGLSGDADITISPTGTIKAVGYLSGQSTNETEFSADALARAVWEAVASDFNTAGTMGQKLNGAGSAGDPWGTDIDGVYAAGTAGDYLNRVKKYVANKLTVSGSTYSVKEDDGSTEFEGGTTTTTERSPS